MVQTERIFLILISVINFLLSNKGLIKVACLRRVRVCASVCVLALLNLIHINSFLLIAGLYYIAAKIITFQLLDLIPWCGNSNLISQLSNNLTVYCYISCPTF